MYKRIGQLYNSAIRPNSTDDDQRRREFILNILLLSSIGLIGAGFILGIAQLLALGDEYQGDILSMSIALGIFLALLIISRKGYPEISARLFVIFFLSLTLYASFVWGITLPQALLAQALTITMSGILLGSRFAFLVSISLATILVVLADLQAKNIIVPNEAWRTQIVGVNDAIFFGISFLVITTVSWLSNREIERSLRRARKSEMALRKERDLLEERVVERTAQLRRLHAERARHLYRFAEVGRITSGLFHDLVNPIHITMLYLEEAKKDAEQGKEIGLENIGRALMGVHRVHKLAKGARRQIQRQEVSMRFNPARELWAVQSETLGYKFRKAGVEIELDLDEDIELFGDPIKFYRVMISLISNAVDSYESRKYDSSKLLVFVRLVRDKTHARITVEDHGSGIKQEDQKKIFEPLFTTKSIECGTGLGLWMCKKIVEEDFNGVIEFSSIEGEGATFIVLIPINSNE